MAVNTVISGCPRTDTSQNRYSPDEGGTTGCQLSLDGIRRLSRVSVGLRSPPMCGSGCIGGVGVEQNLDASSRQSSTRRAGPNQGSRLMDFASAYSKGRHKKKFSTRGLQI